MTDTFPPSLAAALAQLQTQLPEIRKSQRAEVETRTGGTYTYTYANLSSISQQILPLLGSLGLSFIAAPTLTDDGRFVLACKLLHFSGDCEQASYPLPTSGTPQALGSAITYGRRYCLCAMTGVAPEDDDDASAAEAEAQASRGTAQRSRPAQTRRAADTGRPTAQRARPPAGDPPLPGEPDMATNPMLQKLNIQLNEIGAGDREDRLTLVGGLVGRVLTSSTQLTKREAHALIDLTERAKAEPEPLVFLIEQVRERGGGGDA